MGGVLGAIGDLVEDVVVRLWGPVNLASDTDARIERRPGGSAANVALAAVRLGAPARFIGQVGDDDRGRLLVDALTDAGVEVAGCTGGRTGTIVVLVDEAGERTMLADRGSSTELTAARPGWLDGLHTLHVPFYSLAVDPLATTAKALVALAHEGGLSVSVDLSSVGVLTALGLGQVIRTLRQVAPDVVLANEDEAEWIGRDRLEAAARLAVVKRGRRPATVLTRDRPPVEVDALEVGPVVDTTGAGDAFAAGFLVARAAGAGPIDAARRAHAAAAEHIRSPSR